MSSNLFFDNKKYISAKDAGTLTGYSNDYIGQLCRADKLECKRIGRVWYVSEESILDYEKFPTGTENLSDRGEKVPGDKNENSPLKSTYLVSSRQSEVP